MLLLLGLFVLKERFNEDGFGHLHSGVGLTCFEQSAALDGLYGTFSPAGQVNGLMARLAAFSRLWRERDYYWDSQSALYLSSSVYNGKGFRGRHCGTIFFSFLFSIFSNMNECDKRCARLCLASAYLYACNKYN